MKPTVDAEYKLLRQSAGMAHYARIAVSVTEQDEDEVLVAPDAFDWLREAYGPGASIAPYHSQYAPEAVAGALFALHEVGAHARVVVRVIGVTTADTCDGDVRFATAQAVWQALNRRPAAEPTLD